MRTEKRAAFKPKKSPLRLALAALALSLAVTACTTTELRPERTAQANTLISKRDPAAKIIVPAAAKYAGNARFTLYDVADCEIHIFVEAGADKRISRFYWVQFEQYLPEASDYAYDYNDEKNHRAELWGQTWWLRARFGPSNEPPQAGSDLEQAMGILKRAGYVVPPHLMNLRMVRMLDDPDNTGSGRKEMLIFYNEDMETSGFTSEDFVIGKGVNEAKWAPVARALEQRASGRIRVEQ